MRTVSVRERAKALIPDCWACAPAHLTLQLPCVYRGHMHSTWEVGLMQPDVLDGLCKCGRVLGPIFVCNSPDKKKKKGCP